jgi:beta-lactamase superfamily II metal-dependent hydrolase
MYSYENFKIICLLIVVSVVFPGCSTINAPYTDLPRPGTKGSIAIHFIDVGQGDSTFINLSSGENILIDAGSPSGGSEVIRYLKDIGVRKISRQFL